MPPLKDKDLTKSGMLEQAESQPWHVKAA